VTAPDASGDREMAKKGPKKKVKAKAKDGEGREEGLVHKEKEKGQRRRRGGRRRWREEGEERQGETACICARKKPKKGDTSDDAMEVDSEPEKPALKLMPKPKAVTKAPKGDEDEPAGNKQKKTGD